MTEEEQGGTAPQPEATTSAADEAPEQHHDAPVHQIEAVRDAAEEDRSARRQAAPHGGQDGEGEQQQQRAARPGQHVGARSIPATQ